MQDIKNAEVDTTPKNWAECVAKYPELIERRKVCRQYGILAAVGILILSLLFLGVIGLFIGAVPAFISGMGVYLISVARSIPKKDRAFMIDKNPKLSTSTLASSDFSNRINTWYSKSN